MHESIKQFGKAYSFLYEAIKSVGDINDSTLRANVYTVAAQLHISAGVYDKALNYAKLIAEASKTDRELCISAVLQTHALVRLRQSYPVDLTTNAKNLCEKAMEPLMAHTLQQFKAEVDINTDPAAVKASMQAMLPELEQIGFPYAILRSRYFLGYAQLQLNELPAALAELQQVQQLAAKLRDSRTENQALLLLAQLHEKQGDTVAAAQAYKQHISALNAYIDEYKQRSVAYYLAQADFMESENKLALLQSQNELLQLESKLQRDEKVRTGLISVALLTLLLLVIYVLNSKRVALNRLATTDFLTRLFNRRYFNQTVSRQLQNRRQQDQHSLVVFDIDLFKQINDQYGHATGDKVLQAIAQRCQQHIRKQDILARMGGEEFALFLPGCDLAHAKHIAELCRSSIAATPVQLDELHVMVSASFGIASSSNADFDKLLQQADAALYRAKAAGRNCVAVAHSGGQTDNV
ncbi:MAG: GGDEF domain-containing protein [Gammaproteobacteria bacterium]|nr:GGDEF domain-containing protein [Gammaproteobacteria bacterium]MBU1556057.1 GGDEF domain-containing protein [Gammaproteobacteria bacterium]